MPRSAKALLCEFWHPVAGVVGVLSWQLWQTLVRVMALVTLKMRAIFETVSFSANTCKLRVLRSVLFVFQHLFRL